ncbi:MAG: class I SAM-dependent methyltransferase [Candidatus Obscuribacterales bacterium]|nr:class I SAM-dependent methyltransferase [Steroidobacteraceae bacterium]
MKDVSTSLAEHAVHYEASAIPKLRRALTVLQHHLGTALNSYSFIDIGSGKGLVVMLASLYPFRHVYGVEMAPELHRIAQSNQRKFLERNPRAVSVSLECMNALEFDLPGGNVVVYLYNPFDALLMERFIARLSDSSDENRQLLIVYVNSVHRRLFDNDRRFVGVFDDDSLCILRWDALQ